MSAPRLTAKTRRGLRWIVGKAEADYDACLPDDLTDKERAEIEQAFQWLRRMAQRRETEK